MSEAINRNNYHSRLHGSIDGTIITPGDSAKAVEFCMATILLNGLMDVLMRSLPVNRTIIIRKNKAKACKSLSKLEQHSGQFLIANESMRVSGLFTSGLVNESQGFQSLLRKVSELLV